MSMLTPLGSNQRRNRQSLTRLRHAIVLVLAVLLVAGAGWAAWWYLLREAPAETAQPASAETTACPSPSPVPRPSDEQATDAQTTAAAAEGSAPAAESPAAESPAAETPASEAAVAEPTVAPAPATDVNVRVYNATDRTGLAAAVAEELGSRGFTVAEVANAPDDEAVAAPALVRSGPQGEGHARAIWAQVPGATYEVDDRDGVSVDLLLGEGFEALVSAEEAQARAAALDEPAESPTAPGC